ncbi:pimeloyl-ACP methyl ester carboxylesterase [Stackebrandtia albiflava]|uniref:Pimeloyl-ACP methyl ester carboxylesterase n=1 Tax=Stackebrandtia albiflava TaxID=406432 RepID=A0A562UYM4_9ACTN|nr:alpha/beta hydrolase [Stackebrandtia albiflava]TWJ10744.1 pimeloyl-ACP methyl ester carboxylesterase [Stackebrandtia albiflava]
MTTGTDPLVRGTGTPVTVFAHGFGATAADSRPFGGAVGGTRVFYTALAHDGVDAPGFGHPALAAQLREVADRYAADQAFGVSMGAGALCRLLSRTPDRFRRVVFLLPGVLDEVREPSAHDRLSRLDRLAAAGDHDGVARLLRDELPADVRDTATAREYARRHADTICLPSMRHVPRLLASTPAVESAADLRGVTAEALVLGSRGDDAHPVAVAERLAAHLPRARLHVFDDPAVLWTGRRRLRELVGGFLSGETV